MKRNYLTIEQVNLNLQKQFPGKPIECIKADQNKTRFTEEHFCIICTPKQKLAIGEFKEVYIMLSLEKMDEYRTERNDFNLLHNEVEIFGEIYTEWIINKRDTKGNKGVKRDIELLLIACGYKKEKQAETTEQAIKRLIGMDYVRFYKLVKEVKVTGYEFKKGTQYTGHYKLPEPASFDVLLIKHSTGSFSFPITELMANNYRICDTFIQDAFCDVLGCNNPYTMAAMEEIKVPEQVLSKVLSINRSGKLTGFVRRLRTMSKLHAAA